MSLAINTNQDEVANFFSGFCLLIINTILACYFFKFTYNNPDDGSCFANKDGSVAASVAATKLMEGEFINVSN